MSDATSFRLTGRWPVPELSAGQNVLVRHGSDADPTRLSASLAADELGQEEGCVLISTDDAPAAVLEGVEVDPTRPVGVVAQPGQRPDLETVPVRTVALADGFRALGEASQDVIERVSSQPGCRRVRVGFASVSTLLERTSPANVYRFLHIFAQQVRSTDALGLYTLGPGVDDADVGVLEPLFDRLFHAEVDPSGWTRLSSHTPEP